MKSPLSIIKLRQENNAYQGTSGVSDANRSHGFVPAFHDSATDQAYISRFSDGRPAPVHLLDGLPDALILERTASGIVKAVKETVTAGFLCAGRFYTRDQAADF